MPGAPAAYAQGEQPLIGRIVPELQQPKLRERFLYSYRLIHEIGSERKLAEAATRR